MDYCLLRLTPFSLTPLARLKSVLRIHARQASLSRTDRTPFEKHNHHVPNTHLYCGLSHKC